MTLIRTPHRDKKGKTLWFDSVPIMAKKAGWAPRFPSLQTRKLKIGELTVSFLLVLFHSNQALVHGAPWPIRRMGLSPSGNALTDTSRGVSIVTKIDNAGQQSQWYSQLQIQSSWNVCIRREQSLCLWGPLCVQRLALSYHHYTYQPCCRLTVM